MSEPIEIVAQYVNQSNQTHHVAYRTRDMLMLLQRKTIHSKTNV